MSACRQRPPEGPGGVSQAAPAAGNRPERQSSAPEAWAERPTVPSGDTPREGSAYDMDLGGRLNSVPWAVGSGRGTLWETEIQNQGNNPPHLISP